MVMTVILQRLFSRIMTASLSYLAILAVAMTILAVTVAIAMTVVVIFLVAMVITAVEILRLVAAELQRKAVALWMKWMTKFRSK